MVRLTIILILVNSFCFSQTKKITITSTTNVITAFDNVTSDVKIDVVQIERSGGGNVVINDTINLQGKTIQVTEGTIISGNYHLENAVIDASYNQHLFDTTGTMENMKVSGTLVSVKWFGAKGDGITDDQPAIQAAGEAIISNNSLPRGLYFPWGTYKCNKELFFYKWTGTDYGFFSLNLIGQDAAYFNNTLSEAVIVANHNQTFAVGYHMARSSLIKGLVIKGQFNPVGSSNGREYVSRPYSTWATGVADNPTAPYSGINIDPVDNSGTLGITGRYKGLEWAYRGTGTNLHSGSSGIKIEQCRIQGFAINIAISLNSITSNGENVHISDCSLDVCKAAVAYGQDQTKDNFIIRCISWERVHTLVDTRNYGRGTGQAPYVDGWNVAGDCIQLWQLNPLRAASAWRNVFAESIWRIGDGDAGAGLVLESSTINFNLTWPVPPTHLTGAKIVFKGCVIKYYDNQYNKRMRLVGADYRFEDCELDRVPLFDPTYGFGRLTPCQFINTITGDGELGKPYAKGQYSGANFYVAYGIMTLEEGGVLQGPAYDYIKDFKISFNFSWPCKEQRIDQVNLFVNDAQRTATATNITNVAVGDYITSEQGIVYGRISSINRQQSTATLVDVPLDIKGSFTSHSITHWVERIAGQFVGDITTGSNQITNCEYDILLPTPYIGQRLKIGHSLTTPIIESISGGTITMSQTADYSQKGALNYWDRSQQFELTTTGAPGWAGNWPVLIPKGAKFYQPQNRYSTEQTVIAINSGFANASAIGKINQVKWKVQ